MSAPSQTAEYRRETGLLGFAVSASGGLVYLYFVLASHALSAVEYGELVLLWSVSYVAAAVLFRPIELLLARTLAEVIEQGGSQAHAIRVAAVIQAVILAIAVGLAFAGRGALEGDLFGDDATLFAVLIVALIGFGFNFYARGLLAGRRRFEAYTSLLVLESVARVVFAIVVALGIASGQDAIALGIAVAPIISLIVVPSALRRSRPQAATPAAGHLSLAAGGGFAAAVLVVMLAEQAILTSGPLFVRASEGAAAAGLIFNVLLIARAPLVLFQAVATSLLPRLTRLRARGDATAAREFASSVRNTALGCLAFGALVALAGLALGPEVMELGFGSDSEYDRLGIVIVAIGTGFHLTATTLTQAALARARAGTAALCWGAGAVLFLIVNALPGLDQVRQVEIGFAATGVVLCVLLYVLYRRPDLPGSPSLAPGEELELQMAATDEAFG